MSFINPSDMMEEDAADLQFPKVEDLINVVPSEQTQYKVLRTNTISPELFKANRSTALKCCACRKHVEEPYISCAECPNLLCLECFSNGAETQYHKNSHAYIIRHDNLQVFPSTNWTAKDEKLFLDLISTHGYGNWDDISKGMKTKSPDECKEHYHNCYFGGIFEGLLGLSSEPYFPQRIPYLFKMKSIDPPRHEVDTFSFKNMAGYRCARGDFDTPYDNSAESIVSNLDMGKWPIEYRDVADRLNCAMFNAYNHRLTERYRRYKIMKNHGLLMANKTLGWLSKYSEALKATHGPGKSPSSGRFIAFMQIMSGMGFDLQVESLKYYSDVKKYLFKLYNLRSNGIKTFQGGRIYYKLKHKRLSKMRDKRAEQQEKLLDWRNLVPNFSEQGPGYYVLPNLNNHFTLPRRKAAPIDILGLPGYDKLSEDERNLCSISRIVPVAYLEYKNILCAENTKIGYLRLADARRLIKIDVNKTRQLYDFMLIHGYINKPYEKYLKLF